MLFIEILQKMWKLSDTSNYELECNSIERSLAKEKTQKDKWINER